MKIRRTVPPAGAEIGWIDLLHGAAGFVFGRSYLRRLEDGLKRYFQVRHVFLLSSGKAAFAVILQALRSLAAGRDEVVVPAYTCYSAPSAVRKAGCRVSPCDIDLRTFDFDFDRLDEAVRATTLCIVPTHLFGIPADVERAAARHRKQGIFIIEDAAQAMGGSRSGKKLGTIGDAGFFSLGRGKNITCGSGGIIVTNDDRIAGAVAAACATVNEPGAGVQWAALIGQLAMKVLLQPRCYWLPDGVPALKLGRTVFFRDFPVQKLSGVQAGLLRHWERRLAAGNSARRENGASYRKEFPGGPLAHDDVVYLRYPFLAPNRETRDRLHAETRRSGVSLMYPAPISEIPELREECAGRSFPAAKSAADRLIALPTHARVRPSDRAAMIGTIGGGSPQRGAEARSA